MRSLALLLLLSLPLPAEAQEMRLERPTHGGVFLDAAGPHSVFLGYENGPLEGWLYPLKIFQDLQLSFHLEGYPAEIRGLDIERRIEVKPEHTTLIYSHSAFTVRQILFCPRSQRALVSLLDVDSTLPMKISAQFRPRLRLMWPGGLPTPFVDWDEKAGFYRIAEDGRRFGAIIGAPNAKDLSSMPYQEEPRDLPVRMEFPAPTQGRVPLIAAQDEKTYRAVLANIPALLEENARHYQNLRANTVQLSLPDQELQQAFEWSLVGMDKGMVTNPLFKRPGLVAGFRTSGESERPGFAWFFGRDALWTCMATTAAGEHGMTRQALEFLKAHQRKDGRIPHEISQSAPLVDWFEKFPFAWASADATPLYIVAHGDYYGHSGDKEFLERNWESIKGAWHFTAATDKDGDNLMDNTGVGHAWVEGGALYPPHQEIYLQGVFLEAARRLARLAREMGDEALARQAEDRITRVKAATEKTYWLPRDGYYAFATFRPRNVAAEPGPNRERRQRRLDQINKGGLVDEDTVLPSVPMIWGWLDHGDHELDHLGAASMAADWGHRILSDRSQLYDPLSYHYGSVWPLFTGWVSLAAYQYGRPHIGLQALLANAGLTWFDTLGYVTELVSGDHLAAFGRSSHHQIWSEAMVAWPLVRGLLGLEVEDAGRTVVFAPQPPADWPGFQMRRVKTALGPVDLEYVRKDGERRIRWNGPAGLRYRLAFSLPLDAQPNQKAEKRGEIQRVVMTGQGPQGEVVCTLKEGAELVVPAPELKAGQRSKGLRLLRVEPAAGGVKIVADGMGGQSYPVKQVGRPLGAASSAVASYADGRLSFSGSGYQRAELIIPYRE